MIQHAFTGAYSGEVGTRNQSINAITGGIKDLATTALGIAGFTGALGTGAAASASKYALAGRIGGVGGAIMLATMQEKAMSAEKKEQTKQLFTSEQVGETIKAQLGDNPINRAALKQLNTVFDTLTNSALNKKGMLDTSMGEIDPNSELGKKILGGMSE